jgi:hypothetical protein
MTTTTTETQRIEITMSERRPLKIDPEQWPIVAQAHRHDGQVECQANTVWRIYVREHADGRRLVYGWMDRGPGGKPIGWRGATGGFLVDPDLSVGAVAPNEAETIRAIRRIGGIVNDDQLADECIADLPAEEV